MVNIIGVCNLVPPLVGDPNSPKDTNNMTAKAVLQCRPNSHPFPERVLSLDQPVKIGRSVARARPAKNNAIFDCKVLSRNHALLWYENGKFYLQDTKSSNGTFVNNQRLSKGSEESAPREVCSGDIVQYGVDVMENSRKVTPVTHGCIIATLKLYMPDGQEAKASPSTTVGDGTCSLSSADLLHLRTCLQEAQHREQLIESKLSCLQQIISDTQEAAAHSWTAMIDEDRLLQRLENLEGQLTTYAKNFTEDATREEIQRILEEKTRYETSAKDALQRILKEKLDAISKCADVERSMSTTKNELNYMKEKAETAQKELEELLKKQTEQTAELQQMTEKLKAAEHKLNQSKDDSESDKKEMEDKLQEQSDEEKKLMIKIESLQAENDFTKEQLSAIKSKYENIKNGRLNMTSIPNVEGNELEFSEVELQNTMQMFRSAVNALQEKLWQTQEEMHQTQALITQLKSETEAADNAEIKIQIRKSQLQDELTEKKAKEEANIAIIDHIQSRLGVLETRLASTDPDSPKIYEDIYEDHSMTLGRYKKSLKDDDNKDEEYDKLISEDDNEESDSLSDSTLTIINSNDIEKNNMNGTDKGRFEFDSKSLIYIKEDIIKLQEILQLAEASKSSAEEELKRIRDEFGQASTACVTASHEASNLHKQLAANESVILEKTRYVSTLQEVGGQLESSLELIYSHLNSLTRRISQEKEEALNAKNQAEDFRKKLQEAEQLCKESVEEAEKLHAKINSLEGTFTKKCHKEEKAIQSSQSSQEEQIENLSATGSEVKSLDENFIKIEDSVKKEDIIPTLQTEIHRLQKAYDDLKEREHKLRTQLEASNSFQTSLEESGSSRHKSEMEEDEESIAKVKEELRNLMQEHSRLKEKLSVGEGEFGDLYLQNRVTIPTWLMLVVALSIALGWEWIPDII